jgi:uncharacterized membrane protein
MEVARYASTPEFNPQWHEQGTGMSGKLGQMLMVASGIALVAAVARTRPWRGEDSEARQWSGPETATRKSKAVAPAPIEASVTIEAEPSELYTFWRQFENFPRFMKNIESVTVSSDGGAGRSHWVAKAPLGFHAEWDAEIVEEQEGRLLSWRSLPGSQVHTSGTVRFEPAPGGRGTVVHVTLEYQPTGLAQTVGKVLQPLTKQEVREDLRRFKQLVETGEIPTIDGQPAGKRPLINPRNPF